jgi:hypothetical protein
MYIPTKEKSGADSPAAGKWPLMVTGEPLRVTDMIAVLCGDQMIKLLVVRMEGNNQQTNK